VNDRILDLAALRLEPVTAHGGDGRILFARLFEKGFLRSACNFVDYAVLPPGTSIGRHRHGRNEEIYLVLEGRGKMHLDGVDHDVGPGSVILNRPGGTHGLRNVGDGELRIFVVEIEASCEGQNGAGGHA
jgi:mannose-6-phosphate isomerase-like protein (cupin superfamily)